MSKFLLVLALFAGDAASGLRWSAPDFAGVFSDPDLDEVSGLAALAIERGKRPVAANLVRSSNGRIEPCATILGSASRCGQIN